MSDTRRWQHVSEQGEFLEDGGIAPRQAAAGAFCASAELWLWRRHEAVIQVLVQQRSRQVRTWRGFLTASAGGMVDYGETPLKAVLREADEEIALSLKADDLSLAGVFRHHLTPPEYDIIEHEISWVYTAPLPVTGKVAYNDGEVSDTMWMALPEFEKLTRGELPEHQLIPCGSAYYSALTEQLLAHGTEKEPSWKK